MSRSLRKLPVLVAVLIVGVILFALDLGTLALIVLCVYGIGAASPKDSWGPTRR